MWRKQEVLQEEKVDVEKLCCASAILLKHSTRVMKCIRVVVLYDVGKHHYPCDIARTYTYGRLGIAVGLHYNGVHYPSSTLFSALSRLC